MWRWFRIAMILLVTSGALAIANLNDAIGQHDQNSPILKRIKHSQAEYDSEGYLLKLWMPQFRGINFFGELSAFERLKNLEVEYSGHIYNYSFNGVGLLKNLETLRLRYADEINHESLVALQTLPKLQELTLSHTYEMTDMTPLADFPSLKCLQLETTHFNWISLAEGNALERMPIEELRLIGSNKLTPSDWEIITQFPKLRVLIVREDQHLTDDALKALATAKTLKSIHLVDCPGVDGDFLEAFKNSPLEELTLISPKVRSDVMGQITQIKTLRRLKLESGVARRRQRSEEGTGPIPKLGELTRLEELEIDLPQFGLSDVTRFAASANLRMLSLRFYRNFNTVEQELDWLTAFPNLEALRLIGAKPVAAAWISSLQRANRAPEELVLENCQLDDEAIAQLGNCHTLRRLALVNCGMNKERLEKIANLKSLVVLDLQNNPDITDEGLEQIAKFTELRRLRLSGCKLMTGSGFAAFPIDHPLETVVLSRMNRMTPTGLEFLLKLQNLREFSFHSEKITRKHFLTLRLAPDLKIVQMEPKQDLDSVFLWELDEIHPEINRGSKVVNWSQYFSLLSTSPIAKRDFEAMVE